MCLFRKTFILIVYQLYICVNGIYIPSENVNQKPLETMGIKTIGWQTEQTTPRNILMNHNYSKVNLQKHTNTKNLEDVYESNRQGKLIGQQAEDFLGQETENLEFTGQQTIEELSYISPQKNYPMREPNNDGFQLVRPPQNNYTDLLDGYPVVGCDVMPGVPYYPPETTPQNQGAIAKAQPLKKYRAPLKAHQNFYSGKYQAAQTPAQVYAKCPSGLSGQFVYELSCNQFLNCWKGHGYAQNCAPGTLFNPNTLECDFANKVECITGPKAKSAALKIEKVSAKLVAACPAGFSGIIPHYGNCNKFINCADGVENIMDCAPGTLFDVKTNLCDFPYKTECVNNENSFSKKRPPKGNDFRLHSGYTNTFQEQDALIHSQGNAQSGYSGSNNENSGYGTQTQNSYNLGQPISNNQGQFVPSGYQGTSFHGSGQSASNSHILGGSSTDGRAGQSSNQGQYPNNGNTWTGHTNNGRTFTNGQQGWTDQYNQGAHVAQSWTGHDQGTLIGKALSPPSNNQGSSFNSGYNGQHLDGNSNQDLSGQPTNWGQDFVGIPHSSNGQDSNTQGIYGHGVSNQGTYGQDSNTQGIYGHGVSNQGTYGQSSNNQGTYGQSGGQETNGQNSNNQGTYNQGTYGQSSNNQGTYGQGGSNQGTNGQSSKNQGTYGQYSNNQGTYGHSSNQGTYAQSSNNQGSYGQGGHNQGTYRLGYGPTSENPNKNEGQSSNGQFYSSHGTGQNKTTGRTLMQQGTPKCPAHVTGLHPHPNDCAKFLNCANGITYIQDCGPGTHFNPTIMVCDFPYNVKCNSDFINEGTTVQESEHGQSSNNQGTYGQGVSNHGTYNNGQYSPLNQQNGHNAYPNRAETTTTKTWERSTQRNSNQQGTKTKNQQSNWNTNYDNSGAFIEPIYEYPTNQLSGGHNQVTENAQTEDLNTAQSENVATATKQDGGLSKQWPPPFPTTDPNADYFFEYEDIDEIVTLPSAGKGQNWCDLGGFECGNKVCISPSNTCDGFKDCPNGKDELSCDKYLDNFSMTTHAALASKETEKQLNVTLAACAKFCMENNRFQCKAFNFRKQDGSCYLLNNNVGMTGALMISQNNDYFECKKFTIDCSNLYTCNNKRCINKKQVCDGINDCGDGLDERNCSPKAFGYKIKLAGSHRKHEGRIEVQAFGKSGFICDDLFGLSSADVACRELGFDLGALEVKANSHFALDLKENNTFYMMDDVKCLGNETALKDCSFSGWGVHNCAGQEIVGVVCKIRQEECPKGQWQCANKQECLTLDFVCDGVYDCTDQSDELQCDEPIEIRLVNGFSKKDGRIEIKYHGMWGTVCDDDFNDDAAKVVCDQLGFPGSASVRKDSYYGAGEGPIWLDQVFCQGNESTLQECIHWDWGVNNCEHAEDVGVICSSSNSEGNERNSKTLEKTITKPLFPSTCGQRSDAMFSEDSDVHFRVVRGSKAKIGDYPWQASIRVRVRSKSAHWCGAVVISENFVLTAAHCLVGYSKGAYFIVAGDYNVDTLEGTEQEVLIDDFVIHEQFREGNKMNNDIAVIKLKGNGFEFSKDVQAICLPDMNTDYGQSLNCTISGFGSIESGKATASHDLRAGWIPIQSPQVCKMPHVYGASITDGMICAGSLEEGVDACDGDSGGPLACLNQGSFTLYGITSWGQHCGYANKPGVYVKVAKYRDWIEDSMKKLSK